MTEADAEAVAKLSTELGYPNAGDEIRRRFPRINSTDLLLVAVNEHDEPIGFIQATTTTSLEAEPRVHILGLVVSSAVRRAGVARRLIAEVERWAESNGIDAMVVRSNTARGEAHDFYPAVGFAKVKTQAVYLKKLRG